MRIALLDIHEAGDKKDYNGGYGTSFYAGNTLRGRFLKWVREKRESIPLMTYGYISAVLKRAGHEVFLSRNELPQNVEMIILHPTLIRHNEEMNYLKAARKTPGLRICLVGPLASTFPQRFASIADTIITGEAENILRLFNVADDLPNGIVDAGYVDDLSKLPFPDWTIYKKIPFSLYPIFQLDPIGFIQGSRSCASSCNYCPYITLNKPYRARNPEHIVEEIIQLRSLYGTKSILFRDPHFTLNRKRVLTICSLIKESGIKMEWGCDTRSDTLDERLIDCMVDAGLRVLEIGIESLDHRILRKYKRQPPEIKHQERVIRYAEKNGVSVVAFYLLGFPEEKPESIKKTIAYAKKLNTKGANFTLITPIPGTPFYNQIRDRIFDNDLNHYDNFHPVFRSDHISPKCLQRYQEKAIVSYYFRLGYLSRHLRKFI